MLQQNQCFAPTSFDKRCRNKCVPNSKHCELHNPKSTSLYIKYKKLSDKIKDINLSKEFDDISSNIDYVMDCYNLYNKTYEARLKHRKFAIAPNLYDQGHDFQFIDLKNKIDECEKILNNLYTLYENQSTDSNDTDDSDSYEDNSNNNNSMIIYNDQSLYQKIKLIKAYRAMREREIDDYVEKYIKENKIIIERKNNLIYRLCVCISLLFDKRVNPSTGNVDVFRDDYIVNNRKITAMISLIIKLYNINYFDSNFVPRTCQHPECKCKIPYSLSLGYEYLQDARCFCQYMELFSEESLKFIFKIFLFNKKKILPFVDDINELYENYDDDIIYIPGQLVWKHNRLNLQEDLSEQEVQVKKSKTISEMFAVTRLKNKYYERELMKDFFEQ